MRDLLFFPLAAALASTFIFVAARSATPSVCRPGRSAAAGAMRRTSPCRATS